MSATQKAGEHGNAAESRLRAGVCRGYAQKAAKMASKIEEPIKQWASTKK